MLKALEKNTSIEVAKVKRERLREGGRKPAEHVHMITLSTHTHTQSMSIRHSLYIYIQMLK